MIFDLFHSQGKSVCYDEYGCFSNDAPFSDLPLPEDPTRIYPTFYLYENNKIQSPTIVNSTNKLNMNDLILIIHGFEENYQSSLEWHRGIAEKILKVKQNSHVLFVDWGNGAKMGWGFNIYYQPASNTRVIGAVIARFLESSWAFQARSIYCIGFSLGSHVCGFASKSLKGNNKFGRITALDPANPSFDKSDPTARIDKSDAEFVDVMHVSWCGLQMSVGHVDFWVIKFNNF